MPNSIIFINDKPVKTNPACTRAKKADIGQVYTGVQKVYIIMRNGCLLLKCGVYLSTLHSCSRQYVKMEKNTAFFKLRTREKKTLHLQSRWQVEGKGHLICKVENNQKEKRHCIHTVNNKSKIYTQVWQMGGTIGVLALLLCT